MSSSNLNKLGRFIPLFWLGSVAVWFWAFPVKASFSQSDILFEGVYLLAALISFFLVQRLGEWKLIFGWGALCEGLLFDFLDEFTLEAGSRLDVDAMHKASQELIGTADFASFTQIDNYSESTVRTVYEAKVSKQGEMVFFDIKADSFLKQQVRRTVGTLLRVGTGELTIEAFSDIISAKQYGLAGPTAPPYGLYLMKVNYDIELYEEEK